MASLLEQALFLFTDSILMLLIERKGVSVKSMQKSHPNLEGLRILSLSSKSQMLIPSRYD